MAAPGPPSCPLAALSRGAVALCLLQALRLQRGRRRREAARRLRAAHQRRARARWRRRFALLWRAGTPASGPLPRTATLTPAPDPPPPPPARERRLWSKARSSAFWDTVRAKAFGPGEWAENFRLGPATFDYLCGRLRAAIQRRDTNMRRAIPAEVRLAMTLWRLGACTEYRAVEQQFGVSRSTVCKILRDVCEAVVAILTPAYVAAAGPPRPAGFPAPQMAGVLGALHLPIRAPNENAAGYFNRRGWHSVVLQAAVDARGCFWDVSVGCPGRHTDAQVLRASELYQRAQRGELFPGAAPDVGGIQVPVYLLGGPSYPLLPWLMRPYRGGELTPAQRRFNEYTAAARTVVGVAFGRLRGRWRCLQKRNDTDVSFLPTLIAACSTLHNVCEMHGDPFQPRWMVEEEEEEEPFEDEEGEEGAAAEIRDALALTLRD